MAEIVVPLSRQYEAHGEVFKSVTVREPGWEDYLALGEPYEIQRAGGQEVVIENTATIAAYVKRCIVTPGTEKLGELGVLDSRKVRDTVIDFFRHSSPPAVS
ncbi:hypothetical protein [Mesorhizobium sp. WSM3859]|uniref:hypothetical protein n=1 Tax=Mesorhizobium sp. WSM3859 TaxID=2029402 RepID=UPI000BAFCB97|nr:hypothetical protein [Mesorhizobium sp. WSM3859]PBC09196.1 hypothetical protein CK230_17075 [Mesorhizobium sp. WSM3859]